MRQPNWECLPENWRVVNLIEIADIVMGQSPIGESYNSQGKGLPFFQGKSEFGEKYPTVVKWCDQPSKIAEVNDVLFSVRAPVGAVNIANTICCIGRGLAAIRCKSEYVLIEYLYSFLKFAESYLSLVGQGSTFAAISGKELQKILIPLPPLEEQQYIVEILQEVDELRRLRQDSLAKAEKLASALFLEMFGDPITNLMGWEKKTLKSMGRVQTGNTPPRENKNYYGDYIEWIKTDNINTPSPFLTKAKEYLSEDGLRIGRVVEKDSLLVTCIAGSRSVIGNAAIADRRVAFNQQINSFSPNTGNIIFYYFLFLNSKPYIQSFSTDNMKGMISKSTFEKIELIFPPANLQDDFARKAQYCEYIRQECFESKSNLEKIQTQLSSQAFSGVLTEKWRGTQTNLNPVTIKLKTVASAMLVVHGVSRPSKLPAKRGWLLGQLSHFQIRVLEKICEQSAYLTEDGLSNLIDELPEDINHDQEQKVRKTLDQLVALGLIMKVSVQGKEGGFVMAYRALRDSDDSKTEDMAAIARQENA